MCKIVLEVCFNFKVQTREFIYNSALTVQQNSFAYYKEKREKFESVKIARGTCVAFCIRSLQFASKLQSKLASRSWLSSDRLIKQSYDSILFLHDIYLV